MNYTSSLILAVKDAGINKTTKNFYEFERNIDGSFKRISHSARYNMTRATEAFNDAFKGIAAAARSIDAVDLKHLQKTIDSTVDSSASKLEKFRGFLKKPLDFNWLTGFDDLNEAMEKSVGKSKELDRALVSLEKKTGVSQEGAYKAKAFSARLNSKDGDTQALAQREGGAFKAGISMDMFRGIAENKGYGDNSTPTKEFLENLVQNINSEDKNLPEHFRDLAGKISAAVYAKDEKGKDLSVKDILENIKNEFAALGSDSEVRESFRGFLEPMQENLGDFIQITESGTVSLGQLGDAADRVLELAKQAKDQEEETKRIIEAGDERVSGKNRDTFNQGISKTADSIKAKDLKGFFGGIRDQISSTVRAGAGQEKAKPGSLGGLGKLFGKLEGVFNSLGGMMKFIEPFIGGFMSIIKLLLDAQAQQKEWNATILEGASYLDLGAKNADSLVDKLGGMREGVSRMGFNMKYLTQAKDHLTILNGFVKAGHSFDSMTKGVKNVSRGSNELAHRFQDITTNVIAMASAFGSSFAEIAEAQAKAAEDLGMSLAGVQDRFYDIYKASQMSGFGAKRFYSMVSQLSTQLQGYNVRWAQLGQMIVKYSKVLSPDGASEFIKKMATFFGDKSLIERTKTLALMGGTPQAGADFQSEGLKKDSRLRLSNFVNSNDQGVLDSFNKALSDVGLTGVNLNKDSSKEDLEAAVMQFSNLSRTQIAEISSRFNLDRGNNVDSQNLMRGIQGILTESLGASGRFTDVVQSMGEMGAGQAALSRMKMYSSAKGTGFEDLLPHQMQQKAAQMGQDGVAFLEGMQKFMEMDDKTFQQLAKMTASEEANLNIARKQQDDFNKMSKADQDGVKGQKILTDLLNMGLTLDEKGQLREARANADGKADKANMGAVINSVEDLLSNDADFNGLFLDEKETAKDMASEQMWATKDISAILDIISQRIMEMLSVLFNIGGWVKSVFSWISGDEDTANAQKELLEKQEAEIKVRNAEVAKQTEVSNAIKQLQTALQLRDPTKEADARDTLKKLGVDPSSIKDAASARTALDKSNAQKADKQEAADAAKGARDNTRNGEVGLSTIGWNETGADTLKRKREIYDILTRDFKDDLTPERATELDLDALESRLTAVKSNADKIAYHNQQNPDNQIDISEASRKHVNAFRSPFLGFVGEMASDWADELVGRISGGSIIESANLPDAPTDFQYVSKEEMVRNQTSIKRKLNDAQLEVPGLLEKVENNGMAQIKLLQVLNNESFKKLDATNQSGVLNDILKGTNLNTNTQSIAQGMALNDFIIGDGQLFSFPTIGSFAKMFPTNPADSIVSGSDFTAGFKPGGAIHSAAKDSSYATQGAGGGSVFVSNTFYGVKDAEEIARLIAAGIAALG